MFDTHAVARSLTDADFTPAQADAITNAVRLAAEQGDAVTSDQFKAGLAELRSEIAEVRSEIAEVRTEMASLDTRLSTQIAEARAEQRTQLAEVGTEMASLDTRLSTQIAEARAEQRTQLAEVRTGIASLETRLIRWTVGTVIATATLTVAILRLLGQASAP